MTKQQAPFRVDHVGSFLRPERLKEARAKFSAGEITAEELFNYIDQNVFKGGLFANATEKDKQYVIDLVNSYDKYDYTKYVTFTKSTTKNQLVLKSSFK